MARGDTQSAGRRRPKVDKARIAAKVAGLKKRTVPAWVQPLNPGFFALQGAREGAKQRTKPKGIRG